MRQKISIRILIKQDGKVLLVRRGMGRASILGKYELPGAKLEFRQQPRDTLAICLKQYLGVEAETAQLFDVVSFIDPDDSELQYIFILYQASLVDSSISLSDRYDKYVWQELNNIQRNTLTNSTDMLLGFSQEPTNPDIDLATLSDNDDKKTADTSIIYSDGGSRGNPGPSASAFIIMDESEQTIADGGLYLGITTNNQAEYQAVYQALKKAVELGIKKVDFRLDSNLVVNQLNGMYKIKNRDLWPIYQQIKELTANFEIISFTHVRREFNQIADGLVNKILDEHSDAASE